MVKVLLSSLLQKEPSDCGSELTTSIAMHGECGAFQGIVGVGTGICTAPELITCITHLPHVNCCGCRHAAFLDGVLGSLAQYSDVQLVSDSSSSSTLQHS